MMIKATMTKDYDYRIWFYPDEPLKISAQCDCGKPAVDELSELEIIEGRFIAYLDCNCGEELRTVYSLKSMSIELEAVNA